jgi:hypothetical protein
METNVDEREAQHCHLVKICELPVSLSFAERLATVSIICNELHTCTLASWGPDNHDAGPLCSRGLFYVTHASNQLVNDIMQSCSLPMACLGTSLPF